MLRTSKCYKDEDQSGIIKNSCHEDQLTDESEWCFMLLSTVFHSKDSNSSHYPCFTAVSPALGWNAEVSGQMIHRAMQETLCYEELWFLQTEASGPMIIPRKNPEDPMWLKLRTP